MPLRYASGSSIDHTPLDQLPVLILAGGFGTRMRTVYNAGPKAMAPVSGRPFLDYLFRTIQKAGLRRVVLCVGYKHEQIRSWAGDGRAFGLDITYSVENTPLGTAGALRLALQEFVNSGNFIAMNGDSLVQLDFAELARVHSDKKAKATIVLARVADSARYGRVDVDAQDRVLSFAEKSASTGEAFINGGIYLFEKSTFERLPEGMQVSLEKEVLPSLVGNGLFSFKTIGYFIDIGVPEDFHRAQRDLKELFG